MIGPVLRTSAAASRSAVSSMAANASCSCRRSARSRHRVNRLRIDSLPAARDARRAASAAMLRAANQGLGIGYRGRKESCAERQTESIQLAGMQSGKRTALQAGKHALGQLHVIKAEAVGLRVQ